MPWSTVLVCALVLRKPPSSLAGSVYGSRDGSPGGRHRPLLGFCLVSALPYLVLYLVWESSWCPVGSTVTARPFFTVCRKVLSDTVPG